MISPKFSWLQANPEITPGYYCPGGENTGKSDNFTGSFFAAVFATLFSS
jgi:hypothetical protein